MTTSTVGRVGVGLATLVLMAVAGQMPVSASPGPMGDGSAPPTDISVATDTTRAPAASPAAEAEAELNRARAAGESLPPLVRMDLLYHAATEEERWVDSLQAVIDTELESRREAGADSAVVTGYLGALEVVRAKHGTWPPSRIKWVRRGVERLDALVAANPEDAHLRYLRTASTLFLPSLMGREERATADLEILANLLVNDPDPGASVPPAIRSRMVGFVLLHGTWLDAETLERLAETDG